MWIINDYITILSLNVYLKIYSIQKKIRLNKILPLENVKFRLGKPLNLFLRVVSLIYTTYSYNYVYTNKTFFYVYVDSIFLLFDYII